MLTQLNIYSAFSLRDCYGMMEKINPITMISFTSRWFQIQTLVMPAFCCCSHEESSIKVTLSHHHQSHHQISLIQSYR